MSASTNPNLYLDFDGTLVHENSSDVLMTALLARPLGPVERSLARLLSSRLGPWVRRALRVSGRLLGEYDLTLRIVLQAFRRTLRADGAAIMEQVAGRLTLRSALAAELVEPFVIASAGLQPVIEAFLILHPELECTRVHASELDFKPPKFRVKLLSLRHKVRLLAKQRPRHYATDYAKEAELLVSALFPNCVATAWADNGETIFRLKTRA